MSNRLFQGVIYQMRETVDCTIGVIDQSGTIISCSELGKIGEVLPSVPESLFTERETFYTDKRMFRVIGADLHAEYAAFIDGKDEMCEKVLRVCCIALESIKTMYDEKYDRSNFVKNVILENIMPFDIYLKARELHFNNEVSRAVLLIRIQNSEDISAFDTIQNLFPDKTKDFVINVSETDIALVKEVRSEIGTVDLENLARSISDSLSAETSAQPLVGIGSTVTDIKYLARSFKEAKIALEVGKVFDTEKAIVSYDNLGIARLIYQLPTTLCEMFLREVFKRDSIESLDHETLFTIQRFFENNLNVSETSRKLFVHRNTLVYRLEKIKKITGLDLREFDDAIVFKVALMVKKYLDAKPMKF